MFLLDLILYYNPVIFVNIKYQVLFLLFLKKKKPNLKNQLQSEYRSFVTAMIEVNLSFEEIILVPPKRLKNSESYLGKKFLNSFLLLMVSICYRSNPKVEEDDKKFKKVKDL